MISDSVQDALATLGAHLGAHPEAEYDLCAHWHTGARASATERVEVNLEPEVRAAADALAVALPALTQSDTDTTALGALFAGPAGAALCAWCSASTWRRDVRLGPLLALAARRADLLDPVARIARDRVVEGPLLDAL